MITKLLLIAATMLAVLVVPVAVRTLQFAAGTPEQATAMPAVPVDASAAALRLSRAIQIRTISVEEGSPPGEASLAEFHRLLQSEFPLVHALLRREVINGNSLLYRWEGSDPSLRPALLVAHQDVVPVEPGTESRWSYPPFAGAIEDGFVWGRGAIDMKQTLMGLVEAVEALLAADYRPERTILLAFGHDEEIGGNDGARQIVRTLQERGVEVEFVLDEGMAVTHGIVPGVSSPAALIGIAEKGYANFQLIARGPGGHTSNPPSRTTVGALGRALIRIEENPMPARITDITTAMFENLAADMPLTMRVALANQWLFRPLMIARLEATKPGNASVRTTIAPTILRGGVKANSVPQEATAVLNVRLLPGEGAKEVIEHLSAVIKDPAIEIEQLRADIWDSKPSTSATSSAAYGAVAASIRATFPDALVAPGLVIGATDSRHYAEIARNTFRFLPIRLKPDDLLRLHGTDERIAVDIYADSIRFYADLMQRLTWPNESNETEARQ